MVFNRVRGVYWSVVSCLNIYGTIYCSHRSPLLLSLVLIQRRKITVIHTEQSATLVPEIQDKSIKFASNSLSLANTDIFPRINRDAVEPKFRISFQPMTEKIDTLIFFFKKNLSVSRTGKNFARN